jgi:hypothetical protein
LLSNSEESQIDARITSRSGLIKHLLSKNSALTSVGLEKLPDVPFTLDTPATYNIANTPHVVAAIGRVMLDLHSKCGASPATVRTLLLNLTSEATAVGYLAQFQGYEWLLEQGVVFVPEINHPATLRGRPIDLDGKIDKGGHGVFFDIKSFGFEPEYREMFKRRLEQKIAGFTIMIDGSGNHGADAIQTEAFGKLAQHCADLANCDRIEIPALGWTIRKKKRGPGVTFSEIEYSPDRFIEENRNVPLRFASQFTTDAPYILMLVQPDGVGSNQIKRNVFNFSEKLMQGIASYVFGQARTDGNPAKQYDSSLPSGVSVSAAVSRLSGIAFYSRQAKLALLHLNARAVLPLTQAEAQSIARDWKVFEYT